MSNPKDKSRCEWFPALVGLLPTATGYDHGRTVLVTNHDSEAERKAFYESILKLSWLPPEVRRAIFKALDRDYRAYKAEIKDAVAVTLRFMIAEEEGRLREDRKRPRNRRDLREVSRAFRDTAEANVADRIGITQDALKKRLQQRYRKRPKK